VQHTIERRLICTRLRGEKRAKRGDVKQISMDELGVRI
jgi:hypothetical protein